MHEASPKLHRLGLALAALGAASLALLTLTLPLGRAFPWLALAAVPLAAGLAFTAATRPALAPVRAPFAATAAVGALTLFEHAFEWVLLDAVSPVFGPLLEIAAWGSFLACACWSAVVLLSRGATLGALGTLPFTVALAVIGLVAFLPLERLAQDADFHLNREAREELARRITSGDLQPSASTEEVATVPLPPEHTWLSRGRGEVLVQGPAVLFFTRRESPNRFAGFVHGLASPPARAFGLDGITWEPLAENWARLTPPRPGPALPPE